MRAAIVSRAIDGAALLAEVASPSRGATSLFLGTVRNANDGRSVTGIDYAAYDAMAQIELERIVSEASARFGTPAIVAEHRVGEVLPGGASVGIAAAHAHRSNACDATRYVIEEIKKRLPIWKREHYADGTREWTDSSRVKGPVAP